MKNLKLLIIMIVCFALPFSTYANRTNFKEHSDWNSMLTTEKKETVAIIETIKAHEVYSIFMYKDGGHIKTISVEKAISEKGSTKIAKPIEVSCKARVDKKSVFSTKCLVYDDDNYNYIGIGKIDLEPFLKDSTEGKTIRFEIGSTKKDSTPVYFSFSLNGFSEAYIRAYSLIMHNDEDYYENASYFDN